MKRIHDSLDLALQRHRIVFWYDAIGEWSKAFESFGGEGVRKLTVSGNEFGTKVALHRAPEDRFLVYVPTARPADADNWLLDFLLQGYEYKADRASLALQDAGLSFELRPVVEAHVGFFESAKRVEALRPLLTPDESPLSLRLKLLAVASGASRPEIDSILLSFLARPKDIEADSLVDIVQSTLSSQSLTEPFWKSVGLAFGYTNESPSLRDFARHLFRAANPLDGGVKLGAHAQVFLQQWKDSQALSPAFRRWAAWMEQELNLSHQLDSLDDLRVLAQSDTFPVVERFYLHRLCQDYETAGSSDSDLLSKIQARAGSFWYGDHQHGYAALQQAVILRQLLQGAELALDSMATGIQRYTSTWHRIDTAYRKFHFHARSYGQVALTGRIAERVDKTYIANFLLPLSDLWGDQVAKLDTWPGEVPIPKQGDFYTQFLGPFVAKRQKVCVVISDALRYEIAVELMDRLLAENRWKADLSTMLAALPSYTQLGMASLLPGESRSIDPVKRTVLVDGQETAGTAARRELLRAKLGPRATALTAVDFMEMNTATDARALIRDHDVVYLYHNVIDDTGDKLATEAQTAEAVETALEELLKLLKKISNANGGQIILTADHGFLFQQIDVAETDDFPLPAAEWLFPHRRFALGKGVAPTPGVKIFPASGLGLSGDWFAAFPSGLGRFPLKGSGKRFVHGGYSLQETVLPVLRIHKSRTDDTGRVDVDLLRAPTKITTGRVSLTFYQDRPTATKVLARSLRVGVFSLDGVALSDQKQLSFASDSSEARQRETTVELVLSRAADPYNGKEVEIRLDDVTASAAQPVPYRMHRLKLQKPFATDFDEF